MQVDLTLSKLPWCWQVFAFVALAASGIGALFYYVELPMRGDIASRQFHLTALHDDIAKGNATAKKLQEFRVQVAELESRLETLKSVLPEEKDAADLLRRMQVEAARANLEIKGFKPGPTVTKELHAEWPITLELEGTYHNLATFFDRVGKLTRIVNISGLDVKSKEKPEPNATITATCVATTFVLLDKPAPATRAPKGA
jgi:type IV pilus assembly protein PilO